MIRIVSDCNTIPSASKAFNDEGDLADDSQQQKVLGLGRSLAMELKKQ